MIDVTRQAEMLENRVRKTFRHLHPRFERRGIGAFRLYDRDIPEIRAVVDWYEGHVVVGEYARRQTDETPGWFEAIGEAAARAVGAPPEHVHLKRRRTRPGEGQRYDRLSRVNERIQVREGGLRFWVNLDDFLDTGLYPDHRETRALVRSEAKGARFLNLYGYTGTFTCYAAAGGAVESDTVDVSGRYLDWARENLELNELAAPQHRMQREDVRAFLARAARAGRRWTLAVLDPPSFSDRGGPEKALDIQRDHRGLVEETLDVLAPGGVLYFSTNHQRFEPRLDGLPVRECREITAETVPEDYRNKQVHRAWRIVAGVPARR
jgi:23S rRNA G2069 N7-methylase RlmK/C1962 C5-methylase RlmI